MVPRLVTLSPGRPDLLLGQRAALTPDPRPADLADTTYFPSPLRLPATLGDNVPRRQTTTRVVCRAVSDGPAGDRQQQPWDDHRVRTHGGHQRGAGEGGS